jgi:PAS domain S-box-containing protein
MPDSERRNADFYAALLRTHGAILRAREQEPLLRDVCRICVDHGGAKLAFVALVDGAIARPVAWAGPGEAFLPGLTVPLDRGQPEGCGPIATAILEGTHCVSNDLFADPRTLPWRDRCERLGSRATAAFPIRRNGVVVGALSLHVGRREFFDDAVIGLLDAMTADVSFALDNLDREAARREAVSAAEAGLERFQKIFHATPVATVISTLEEGRLVDVNDAYCALVDRPRDELIGRTTRDIDLWLAPDARAAFVERITAERRVKEQEMRVRARGGVVRDVTMSAELIEFAGTTCVLAILNDVTERKRYESRIEFLATHDALTGLPNRNLMLDRITQALQHARRGWA